MVESNNDSMNFEDAENYRGSNESLSIRELVLRQFQRCIFEGGKEINLSGYVQRFVNGQLMELPVPDQAEIFIENVLMLRMIMIPHASKKTLNSIDEYEQREQEILAIFNKERNQLQQRRAQPFGKKMYGDTNSRIRDLNAQLTMNRVRNARRLLESLSYQLKEMNYYSEAGAVYVGGTDEPEVK